MVAHFGLGADPRVDQLEIRWPSGQVDVLTDVPADQKIRVFEGRDDFHVVEPTVWVQRPVAPLITGQPAQLRAAVRVSLFEPEARVIRITADLTELGGPSEAALLATNDGEYALDVPVSATENGVKSLEVPIEQETSLGPYWTRLSQRISVFPGEDLVIYADTLAPNWTVTGQLRADLDSASRSVVYRGDVALAVQTVGNWRASHAPGRATGSLRISIPPVRLSSRGRGRRHAGKS